MKRRLVDKPRRPLQTPTGSGWQRKGAPKRKRRPWTVGQKKCQQEGACRICKREGVPLDPHHVVYASLAGDNARENCIPVCRACHRAIHDKKAIDVWDFLGAAERRHAIDLLGQARAFELLIPSTSRKRTAA